MLRNIFYNDDWIYIRQIAMLYFRIEQLLFFLLFSQLRVHFDQNKSFLKR